MKRVIQLAYKRYGSGQPLVLVHGYLSDGNYWRPLVPKLAEHYDVIVVDLLGFGDSPKPATASYSLDEHAELLAETIKQLTNEPAIVIGHSMGALISAHLAVTQPTIVKQLLLLNMPLFPDRVQAREVIKRTGPAYQLLLYSPFARVLWPIVRFIWPVIRPLLIARRLVPGPPGAFSTRHSYASRVGSLKHTVEVADAMQLLRSLTQSTTLILGIFDRNIYQRTLNTSGLPENVAIEWVDTGHHTIYQVPQAVLNNLVK